MKRCTKCVLPENYPGITFNEEGICNYCFSYKKKKYPGKEELEKFLDSYRNKNENYDCIVGISGGRDSSYVLYYLVKVCGLRVLAYTADNGFISEQAKLNMKNMTDILNVDHVIEEHDYVKKCIRQNIQLWMHNPSPALIGWICNGCKLGIDRGALNIAKKKRIPLIVAGGSRGFEGTGFKKNLLMINPNSKVKSLSLMLGALFQIIKNSYYILNPTCLIINIKEFIYHFSPFPIVRKMVYPNLKIISLFAYVEWDEKKILTTIKKELKWKKSSYSESTWRMDCKINILKNYLYKETLGFTEKEDGLSCLIRENMITREEALDRLKRENVYPKELIAELFNELELNLSDLKVALKIKKGARE